MGFFFGVMAPGNIDDLQYGEIDRLVKIAVESLQGQLEGSILSHFEANEKT